MSHAHNIDLTLKPVPTPLPFLGDVTIQISLYARVVKILDHDLNLVRRHIYIDETHLRHTKEITLAGVIISSDRS